jgi:UDP-glucose 4-epimerase
MVIGDNDQFKAVVLSLDKYNELLLQSGKVVEDIITKVNNQTVLITGGAGYIGSHCTRQLLAAGYKVIVLDNLSSGKRENIPAEAIFIEGDYGDLDLLAELFSREAVSSVIHFAASILVQESLQNPNEYFTNNVLKTTHLLAAMAEFGIKRILFSSTAGVYGPSNESLTEGRAT